MVSFNAIMGKMTEVFQQKKKPNTGKIQIFYWQPLTVPVKNNCYGQTGIQFKYGSTLGLT